MATYNKYSSNATNSMVEKVVDEITTLNPNDLHLYQTIPHVETYNVTHEWLRDSLATPTSNAAVDGADATAGTDAGQTRPSNVTQIIENSFKISGTQQAVKQYGKPSREVGYQTKKHMKELLNDTEWSLIQQVSATGAAATARKMSGALAQITTNVIAYTGAAVVTASDVDFEDAFNGHLQTIYSAGGNPAKAIVGPFTKRRMSTWSLNVTRNVDASERRMIRPIDVYDADFAHGLRIIPHRNMVTSKMLIMDPEYWAIPHLRRISVTKLAKAGDADHWQILHELTLELRSEAAQGQITGLVTS